MRGSLLDYTLETKYHGAAFFRLIGDVVNYCVSQVSVGIAYFMPAVEGTADVIRVVDVTYMSQSPSFDKQQGVVVEAPSENSLTRWTFRRLF